MILWGFFKKLVIADALAPIVDDIFANYTTYSGSTLILGVILFSFQIYGDFSGYSDIAIGTSKLFGIELKSNFKFPIFSRNVAEYWQRWHISLSTWFRHYLYIPLGGNRGGSVGTWIALIFISAFIIMLSGKMIVLCGFIWGALLLGFIAIWVKPFRAWLTTNINLLITMLLGGLWHGASWQFVIWGGLNALFFLPLLLTKKN